MRFFILTTVAALGCSSANFDVTSAPADDAAAVSDSAPGEDATSPVDSGGGVSEEAGVMDGGSVGPCSDMPPTPPCITADADYSHQIDTDRVMGVTKLYKGREILVHVKMPRAGRFGKLILRMIAEATEVTGPYAGQVTVTAYLRGCTGPIPIGKSILAPQTGEDWMFYFNESSTVLPPLPAGTDLDFVVTTDSTAYRFNMIGANPPSSNPYGLYWGQREGSVGEFMRATGSMLSIMVYTYRC